MHINYKRLSTDVLTVHILLFSCCIHSEQLTCLQKWHEHKKHGSNMEFCILQIRAKRKTFSFRLFINKHFTHSYYLHWFASQLNSIELCDSACHISEVFLCNYTQLILQDFPPGSSSSLVLGGSHLGRRALALSCLLPSSSSKRSYRSRSLLVPTTVESP